MNLDDFIKKVIPTKNKLFRFALSYVKSEEDAEDIVQEVMIKVWKKKESLNFYQNVEAWCMTVTKNLSLDRLKSKQFQMKSLDKSSAFNDENPTPYHLVETDNLLNMVNLFIDNLPEKQKAVIHLRDVEGFSYQEIVDILKMDMNQVKVNLFRARKSVKQQLLKIENYGN